MNNGILISTCHRKTSRNTFAPHVQIVPCISDDLRLACGSRRCMYSDYILHRYCEETCRIILSDVFLRHEGKLRNVLQRLDIFRLHACFVHLFSVVLHIVIYMFYCCLELLELQDAHGAAVRAFHFLVPNHFVQRIPFFVILLFCLYPSQYDICPVKSSLAALCKSFFVEVDELRLHIVLDDLDPCILVKRQIV